MSRVGPKPTTGPTETTPLTPTDIIGALESSGYPFEMQLYRLFQAAGMDPTIGQRFKVREPGEPGDGQLSREMDLLARWNRGAPSQGYSINAMTTLIMEAKKVHDPIRIVGILGEAPTDFQHRVWRAKFHGCPSYGILEESEAYGDIFLKDIANCVQPLLAAPFCVHWAAVRRKKGTSLPFAAGETGDEDARLHDSLHTLTAMARWLENESSTYLHAAKVDVNPLPMLGLYLPTLVVSTPQLMVYDAATKQLTDVSWFSLSKSYEINGQIVHRVIDVVSEAGVPDLIVRTKAVGDLLFERLQANEARLRSLGMEIRKAKEPGLIAISVPGRPRRI